MGRFNVAVSVSRRETGGEKSKIAELARATGVAYEKRLTRSIFGYCEVSVCARSPVYVSVRELFGIRCDARANDHLLAASIPDTLHAATAGHKFSGTRTKIWNIARPGGERVVCLNLPIY